MGRPKVAALRALASSEGWLVADAPLPEDAQIAACLLYTSDAADERSSVELGGRRIIKNKQTSIIVQQRTMTVMSSTVV